MVTIQNLNIEIVTQAVKQLGELVNEMVFLGGCATGLLMTDSASPPIRQTRDVDALVQVSTRAEYYKLAEALRKKGFKEDTSEGAPMCRWQGDIVILDVMPTDARILGFGNKWYESAMDHAEKVELPSGHSISMVSAPYFLITKLEAFDGRGKGDYQLSHDIEDIIALLDGRVEVVDEVSHADDKLRHELSNRFSELLMKEHFIESIPGHMPPDEANQERASMIRQRISAMAEMNHD